MKTRRKTLTALQKSAKGQDCMANIPGHCNYNSETVVLAHLNAGGMGQKELDFFAAFCCSGCHDVLDSRVSTKFSRDDLRIMHYEAVLKTQKIWLRYELATYKGQPDMSKVVFYN